MKKRPVFNKLALVLLAIFLVIALKPLWQKAWIYMSGAVIPYGSATHRYADHHNLLLSVGGERWVSGDRLEKATAYHALVIPPEVELREDGSISGNDGVSHTDTLKWLRLRGQGDDYQAESGSLTIVYHALTQKISVGSDTYRLAKGNVFVVRLDEGWRPTVTQIEATLDKATESDEVVELFKRVLPEDEVVKKLY